LDQLSDAVLRTSARFSGGPTRWASDRRRPGLAADRRGSAPRRRGARKVSSIVTDLRPSCAGW